MKYAVIGLGIGAVHARVAAKLEGLELVGVCDLNEDRVQAVAQECGTRAFTDWEQMLAEVGPEAISLATNPKSHLPLGKALAERGVHVLCEKPMAASVEECEALAEACEQAGVVLAIAQKKRFAPATAFLKEHIGGDFGAPVSLTYRFHPGQVPMDWFWAEDDGGGPLVENAVHVFDTLRYVIGDIQSIQGLGGTLLNKARAPQLDIALGLLQFANGCIGSVQLGTAAEWCIADEEFYVACEKAVVRWRGGFDCPSEVLYVYREEGQPHTYTVDYSDSARDFAAEISQFVRAIEGQEPPLVSGRDAARSIAACLGLKAAVREGRKVEL
jgi:UDP-N-acetylglucosamine 3-dehydrogenase